MLFNSLKDTATGMVTGFICSAKYDLWVMAA